MLFSLYSDDMQSSREEEPELSSVLELENLRKSLDHGHSFHFDKTAKTCDEASALDASWVMHEEDSVVASQDSEREKRQLPVTPIVGDMLSMPASLSKLPRISDTSAAPTEMAGERRESDMSDRDRRITLGWLAVEDALAASVSELTDSLEEF